MSKNEMTDVELSLVVSGAVAGYLGHEDFVLNSIYEIVETEDCEGSLSE